MNLPISSLDPLDCRQNSFVLVPNHSWHVCCVNNSLHKAGALFDGKFSPHLEKQGGRLHLDLGYDSVSTPSYNPSPLSLSFPISSRDNNPSPFQVRVLSASKNIMTMTLLCNR